MRKLFRYTMPYCLQKEKNDSYVVVNRDYKPIGFNTSDGINYPEYPILHKLKGLTPAIAAQISCHNDPELRSIYLYDDGSVPTNKKKNMQDYLKRLEILNQLYVEE